MISVEMAVDAYCAAWRAVDEAERRRLLDMSWSEDGVYQDPTADVSGREALVHHIAGFFQRMPGFSLVTTSGVDHHHGKIHFLWKMQGPDGQTALEGRDFGEIGPDGRIRRITGFFGPPPPLAAATGSAT